MVVHPTDPNTVYIATMNGVFETTDGGENWIAKNNGLPSFSGDWDSASDIVIEPKLTPSLPDTLYIMISSELGGIYKTTDGGDNWSLSSSSIQHNNRFSLAIDPGNSIVYAVGYDGLYETRDGGNSWVKKRSTAAGIFTDPNDSNILIITDFDELSMHHVYRSTDGGMNWKDITDDLPAPGNRQILTDPSDSNVIYATSNEGFYKTINPGDNCIWFQTWEHTPGTTSISINKNLPNILYVAAGYGIYKTTDFGDSWGQIYDGGSPLVSSNLDTLYANIAVGKLIKSLDGGHTWETKQSGLIGYSTTDIHFPPADFSTILVGTRGAGLYISKDYGNTWEQKSIWTGVVGYLGDITSVATDPVNENVIYGIGFDMWGGGYVFKSTDGGNSAISITPTDGSNFSLIVVDPSSTSVIYVSSGSGIYKSTDGGEMWEPKNLGLLVQDVRTLVIDPTDHKVIYAGTYGGAVFKTIDEGEEWFFSGSGLTNWNIKSLAIDPNKPYTLYAGTIDGAGSFFKSTDGGANWTPSNNGLPANTDVQDMAIDPYDSSVLFLATKGDGVFQSSDGGASWTYANTGLPDMNILSIGRKGNKLYAGTRSKGLWSATVDTNGVTVIGERMVPVDHESPDPPFDLPKYDWEESQYHSGVGYEDKGAWTHSGDYVQLDFNIETGGNYQLSICVNYSGSDQLSEDLQIYIDPGTPSERNFYTPDDNSINGYTTYNYTLNNLQTGKHIIRFIGPNENQSVHIPWYMLRGEF